MYKRKNTTGIIGIVITIILLILVVIFSNVADGNLSYFDGVVRKIIMPVQSVLTSLKNKVSGNDDFFADMDTLKKENEALKTKNAELEQSVRELEMLKADNLVLQEYAKMLDKYAEYATIPAYVINTDISNYSNIYIINVGEKDGIKKDMTVISEAGLVGHIIEVSDSTSKVQTIIDVASSVSSTIASTRDNIICKGMLEDKNKLKGTYIPTEANLLIEDRIETSGMGGIYPKGIFIGTIKEIKSTQNITDRYAIIETAVNFDKLETVLVIK